MERGPYLSALRQAISRPDRDTPIILNLKKVECENLDFSQFDLQGSSFSQAQLTHCHFIGSNLSQSNLIGTKFKDCDFVGADLSGANATKASFTNCSFSHADLRDAFLIEAHFGETDFMGSILWNVSLWNADISGARHIKKKNFNNPAKPNNTQDACLAETNAIMACESYRSVKHYLYGRGLYEDASWAAYRELTMQRKHFFESKNPRYFPSLLMDILSGYTEKPNRVILSALGIILLFGFIYFVTGAVRPTIDSSAIVSSWDHVYFSFITFTTVGFGDFVPKPFLWVKILVSIEAFSGPFMAGLYVFTLTRRYSSN